MSKPAEFYPPAFEPLEPRQLLSGDPSTGLSQIDSEYTSVIIGKHEGATANWHFTDSDGDSISPRLTGPGWVEFLFDGDPESGSLCTILFHGTNGRSQFTVDVRQDTGNGDGWFNCDGTFAGEDGAGLGRLDLSRVDWRCSEGIFFNGAVGTLLLGEPAEDDYVNSCPAIVVTCDPSDRLNLVAGDLTGLSTLTFSGILSATVDSLSYLTIDAHRLASLDVRGDCIGAEIIADSIGRISVQGALEATITTRGDIDAITVDGGDASVDITCDGGIGSIRVTGGDFTGQIVAGGAIETVSVSSAVVREDGEAWRVGGSIYSSWFEAASIGTISASGGDITYTDFVTTGGIGTISAQAVTDRIDGNVEVVGGTISNCTITSGGPVGRVADASGDVDIPVTTSEITVSDGEAWVPDANNDSSVNAPASGGDEEPSITFPVIGDGSPDIPTWDPTIGPVLRLYPVFRFEPDGFRTMDGPSLTYSGGALPISGDGTAIRTCDEYSRTLVSTLHGTVAGSSAVVNAAEPAQTPLPGEQDNAPTDGDGGKSAPAAPQGDVVSGPTPIGLTGGDVGTPARAGSGIHEIAVQSVGLIAPAFCADVRLAASEQPGRFDPAGSDAPSADGDSLGNRVAAAGLDTLSLDDPAWALLA